MENVQEGDKVASDNQPTVEENEVVASDNQPIVEEEEVVVLYSLQPASRPDFTVNPPIIPKAWKEYVQRKSTTPFSKNSLMYNFEFKRLMTDLLKNFDSSCKPSAFLGCEKCYTVFPAWKDYDLRKHMLIKHGDEFEADEIAFFESCKPVLCFRRCKKCGLDVLEDGYMHLASCDPEANYDEAFYCYPCYPQEAPFEAKCGLCYYKYVSRYELRAHIKFAHRQLFNKIILAPEYRCGGCLKCLGGSTEAMNHVALCQTNEVGTETLFGLAVRYLLYCSVCSRFHLSVEVKRACHTRKALRECFICDAIFKKEVYLLEHMQQYHSLQKCKTTGEVKMTCPFCAESGDLVTIRNHVLEVHYTPMLTTIMESCSEEAERLSGLEILENMPSTSQASTTETSSRDPVVAKTAEKQPACSTETPDESANLGIHHPRDLPQAPMIYNVENEQERETVATESEPTIEKEVASSSALKQASVSATAVETGPGPSSSKALAQVHTTAAVPVEQQPACSTQTHDKSANLGIHHSRDLPQAPQKDNEENEQEREKVTTEDEPIIEKEIASSSSVQLASLPATAIETGPEPSSSKALPRIDRMAEVAPAQPPASPILDSFKVDISLPPNCQAYTALLKHPARNADDDPEPKTKKIRWSGKLFSGFFKP